MKNCCDHIPTIYILTGSRSKVKCLICDRCVVGKEEELEAKWEDSLRYPIDANGQEIKS